jgi:hypothetical protein
MCFKCPFCSRTFSKRSAYALHTSVCVKRPESDSDISMENENSSENTSFNTEVSEASTMSYEESQNFSDSGTLNFQEPDFQEPEELNFQEPEELNFQELEELNFQEPEELNFQELEELNFQEPEELNFQEHEETESHEFDELIYQGSNELKAKEYTEFPNKAYEDLMLLVTKYNLNNKAGNAIIQFFNKHSNLTQSPLPKSIEKGKIYMNNIKSNLTFTKTLIKVYNNEEYFLHHQNLINCIKNILAIPDITQDFALSFEDCKVKYY